MKIDKLYTLSQFVDYVKQEISLSNRYLLIEKYNDFLKQPLTKEMFVNEIEKPFEDDLKYQTVWLPDINDFDTDYDAYNKDLKAWQEAEKKVIFNIDELEFYNDDMSNLTMEDLAVYYDGELELKNVEI